MTSILSDYDKSVLDDLNLGYNESKLPYIIAIVIFVLLILFGSTSSSQSCASGDYDCQEAIHWREVGR